MRITALLETLGKALLFAVCTLACFACMHVVVYADETVSQGEVDVITAKDEQIKEAITTEFSVSPVVANEKAKPRDIIKKELLVTNNTEQRVDLYITVLNIDPTDGAGEFTSPAESDLSRSLANWIEITRGVIELSPGESRKIPYLIHVNLSAKPGTYYARIQFRKGSKRAEAEASKEGTGLMLTVEVQDDAKERLELGTFISEDNFILGDSASFSYLLENVGNRDIEPRGSIRIFNRRGEEVGSVPLNAEGEQITPQNKRQLAAAWNTTGRFGKYKAFLDLEYGDQNLASVQDTVYFWVFPWKEIFASLAGVFVLAIVGTYIIHMRAIAQPSRAYTQRAQVEDPTPQRQGMRQPQQPHQHQQHRQQQQQHVTVLRAKEKSQSRTTTRRLPELQGKKRETHVTLNAHHAAGQNKKQGNVVELQRRR